jgi:hypothetical protein
VQKYEKGTNRMGSSRVMQIANVLQVPTTFFFEDAPGQGQGQGQGQANGSAPSSAYVSKFLATTDGLALTRAFMRLPSAKLRRSIVNLVERIAEE